MLGYRAVEHVTQECIMQGNLVPMENQPEWTYSGPVAITLQKNDPRKRDYITLGCFVVVCKASGFTYSDATRTLTHSHKTISKVCNADLNGFRIHNEDKNTATFIHHSYVYTITDCNGKTLWRAPR